MHSLRRGVYIIGGIGLIIIAFASLFGGNTESATNAVILANIFFILDELLVANRKLDEIDALVLTGTITSALLRLEKAEDKRE
jgi:acyl-CoA synthetase (AMP-forming)/AMP-acid ligase II